MTDGALLTVSRRNFLPGMEPNIKEKGKGLKNLILVGAGGCGREVLQWAKDINKVQPMWNIKGFLNDPEYLDALDGLRCTHGIIGTIDGYEIQPEDEFICCIGEGAARRRIIKRILERGARLTNVIHPTAVICDSCLLGEGVIVYPYAVISDNARIGDGCIINMHSTIAHNAVLGEYCTISAHCDVTGRCTLGRNVFMGSCSNMVPGSRIGDDAFICAGSTVMGRIRPGEKVIGIPARRAAF